MGSLRVYGVSVSREGLKWRAFLAKVSDFFCVQKLLAMCESEADAATCFARFRAYLSFVVGMIALPLT